MHPVRWLGNSFLRWKQVSTLRRFFARQPLVARPCPICGAERPRLLTRGDRDFIGIRTSQCPRCGLIFSSPFYTPETVADFYREQYRSLFKGQPDPRGLALRHGYLRERAAFYLEFLEVQRILPALDAAILDVGCGDGTLLRALRDRYPALALAGVEPTTSYARHLSEEADIPVVGSMAELEPERQFDLVLLVHVLEHVHDPVSLLRQANERLRPGGIVYVDVPDVGTHGGIQDLHLAHCNHFSVHTLGAALARGGLEAIRIMPHRPPTLPPSLFAIARRRADGGAHGPVEPDPAREDHARRVGAIDVGRLSYWRKRLGEHVAHRKSGKPANAGIRLFGSKELARPLRTSPSSGCRAG